MYSSLEVMTNWFRTSSSRITALSVFTTIVSLAAKMSNSFTHYSSPLAQNFAALSLVADMTMNALNMLFLSGLMGPRMGAEGVAALAAIASGKKKAFKRVELVSSIGLVNFLTTLNFRNAQPPIIPRVPLLDDFKVQQAEARPDTRDDRSE